MKNRSAFLNILLLAALLAVAPEGLTQESTLTDAISAGEAGVDLRYRYEFVDQDGFDDNANASTLRLRLNYRTGSWRAWSGFLEFDHIFEVLLDDFNSGAGTSSPGRDVYPVVADPDGPDLNQLFLQFAPNDDWQARIGRQRITHDEHRFVGNVGWRQNEQTFDALNVSYRGFGNSELTYSYIGNANRIYGREVDAGEHRQQTHLLHANTRIADAWKLTGYAYLIDNEDAAALSTRTLGLRADGDIAIGDDHLQLLAEFATQSDYADNPASFDTRYFHLRAEWVTGGLTLGAGFESLGSDAGESFRTPLATLHAFNGWADQFLATPADGLEDLYLKLGCKPGQWGLQLIYHDFSAESGHAGYASEIDAVANRKLGPKYGLMIKLAAFDADDAAFPDTTKFWVMLTASY
jgi:Alginate export